MREMLISYGPMIVSLIGALLSAIGAFSKDSSRDQQDPTVARRAVRLVLVGALVVMSASLLNTLSQISSSRVRDGLQTALNARTGEVAARTKEVAALAKQLDRKSEKITSLTEQIAGKSDETAAVARRIAAKDEEIAVLARQLAAKEDELASLSQKLAANSEENSQIRKQDLETRHITEEGLLRLIAQGCISDPNLRQQAEEIHNKFQRGASAQLGFSATATAPTESATATDSATIEKKPVPKNSPHKPKKP